MKRYIDGFVLPVPKKNLEKYKKMARDAGKIWIEHGALQYTESVMEDATEHPFCTSFKKMVTPKKGETIMFSLIVYKSRAHRDKVNKKVMADPRMSPENAPSLEEIPFDCKRMAWNGFETILNLSA